MWCSLMRIGLAYKIGLWENIWNIRVLGLVEPKQNTWEIILVRNIKRNEIVYINSQENESL